MQGGYSLSTLPKTGVYDALELCSISDWCNLACGFCKYLCTILANRISLLGARHGFNLCYGTALVGVLCKNHE